MTEKAAEEKLIVLTKKIREMGSVAVAFSGGVDSTFLLKAAKEALGEHVLAITASSLFFPEREEKEAAAFCRQEGIRQIVLKEEILDIKGIRENPKNRCYLCKRAIFEKIIRLAKEHGIFYVAEGSNMDDLSDDRPGMQAVKELHVKSPLREAGLLKEEIRFLSKKWELPTWEKPSFACLASRFVFGEEITKEKLSMVERAEQLLFTMGFRQFRVRLHGSMARIELLPEEFERMMEKGQRTKIIQKFTEYGFSYITLDLKGYQMGSMNL